MYLLTNILIVESTSNGPNFGPEIVDNSMIRRQLNVDPTFHFLLGADDGDMFSKMSAFFRIPAAQPVGPPPPGAAAAAAAAAAMARAGAQPGPSSAPGQWQGQPPFGYQAPPPQASPVETSPQATTYQVYQAAQPGARGGGHPPTPQAEAKCQFNTAGDECQVCLIVKKGVFLFSCGHFPYCSTCMKDLSRRTPGALNCPVCKVQVKDVRQVFRLEKIN